MHIDADRLIDALRAEGLRITRARRAVCRVIAEGHSQHLTAASIHQRATEEIGADLDMSTVYRTLEALEGAGVLVHGHLGHGASVYHLASEPIHQHLVCDRCGKTVAIAEEDIASLLEGITARTGFRPNPSHFALSGVCASCADSP